MAHAPEPAFTHDRTPRIGVLLTSLGTPDAPTPAAVRRYLAQFLSDPRVIEIPGWAWQPVLHGVVLRLRPAQSAKRYAAIWTKDVKKAHRAARALQAGTVWVNTYNLYDAASPYGGTKASGFGRETGMAGLDFYTQTKSVWVDLS